MRSLLSALLLIAAVAAGCSSKAPAPAPGGTAPTDPKTLYSMEVSAAPVQSGEASKVHIAIRTVDGAEVKEETPFRAKLEATGPLALRQTEFGYADHARLEGGGPVFEFPVDTTGAGQGEVKADMTFFVCMAEACLRTTEQLSIPVPVN